MLIFIIGIIFVTIVGESMVQKVIYDPDRVLPWITVLFRFLPMFNLSKAMSDITAGAIVEGKCKLVLDFIDYGWHNTTDILSYKKRVNGTSIRVIMPSTCESFYLLALNLIGYSILVWYLDKVLPGENGRSQPWNFIMKKSYWKSTKTVIKSKEMSSEILSVRKRFYIRMLRMKSKNVYQMIVISVFSICQRPTHAKALSP